MSPSDVDLESPRLSSMTHLVRGALLRVVLSVLVPVVWISLTLVYVAFFASAYSFFQDFVIVVVSLLMLVGAVAAMWISYGMRFVRGWEDW